MRISIKRIKNLMKNIFLLLTIIMICLLLFEFFLPYDLVVSSYTLLYNESDNIYMSNDIPLYHPGILNLLKNVKEKKKNTIRIFMLGDSFTYGHGVDKNETYSFFLQKLLNQNDRHKNFEVINVGVCGYNIVQVYEVFKEILNYKPDIIIYGIFVNDFEPVKVIKDKNERMLAVTHKDEIQYIISLPFNNFFLKNSKLFRYLNRVLIHTSMFEDGLIKSYKPNMEISENILKDMVQVSNKNKIQFYAFLIPDLKNCEGCSFYTESSILKENYVYHNFPSDLKNFLKGDCNKIRIDYLDDYANGHPTVEGHKLFAKLLYEFLVEKKEFQDVSF